MSFIEKNCSLKTLRSVSDRLSGFSCGDSDLDEFFKKDARKYEYELFGKTYCFQHKDGEIACLFTVSNGGIQSRQMKNNMRRKIAQAKRLIHNYPSVLIGRLAVSDKFQEKNVGSEVLDFLKIWFSDSHNKTGYRFLAVDAYNSEGVIRFYARNRFDFIFKSEGEERKSLHLLESEPLRTRMMCFDLFQHSISVEDNDKLSL